MSGRLIDWQRRPNNESSGRLRVSLSPSGASPLAREPRQLSPRRTKSISPGAIAPLKWARVLCGALANPNTWALGRFGPAFAAFIVHCFVGRPRSLECVCMCMCFGYLLFKQSAGARTKPPSARAPRCSAANFCQVERAALACGRAQAPPQARLHCARLVWSRPGVGLVKRRLWSAVGGR